MSRTVLIAGAEYDVAALDPAAEVGVRLAAVVRWAQHAQDGRTDPATALEAIEGLVRSRRRA